MKITKFEIKAGMITIELEDGGSVKAMVPHTIDEAGRTLQVVIGDLVRRQHDHDRNVHNKAIAEMLKKS